MLHVGRTFTKCSRQRARKSLPVPLQRASNFRRSRGRLIDFLACLRRGTQPQAWRGAPNVLHIKGFELIEHARVGVGDALTIASSVFFPALPTRGSGDFDDIGLGRGRRGAGRVGRFLPAAKAVLFGIVIGRGHRSPLPGLPPKPGHSISFDISLTRPSSECPKRTSRVIRSGIFDPYSSKAMRNSVGVFSLLLPYMAMIHRSCSELSSPPDDSVFLQSKALQRVITPASVAKFQARDLALRNA